MPKRKTHAEFIAEMRRLNPTIRVVGTYVGADTKIACRCRKCGCKFSSIPSHLRRAGRARRGSGCPDCSHACGRNGKLIGAGEYDKKLLAVNPDISRIEEYVNNATKILHLCHSCHKSFSICPNKALRGRGCPACASSKAEKHLTKLLESQGIPFEREVRYLIKGLKIDFYLPTERLAIETSGMQHWKTIARWGGEKGLRQRRIRDRRKERELAKLGIRQIVLPYTIKPSEFENFIWFRNLAGSVMRTHKAVKTLKHQRLKFMTDWLKSLRSVTG